uniref:Pseudouridylate synthase RPUSD4, mitochondrial n=1 Tax=Ornithorhynchus anatinus TaxID=9258 RepID=F6QNS2_ORNAN
MTSDSQPGLFPLSHAASALCPCPSGAPDLPPEEGPGAGAVHPPAAPDSPQRPGQGAEGWHPLSRQGACGHRQALWAPRSRGPRDPALHHRRAAHPGQDAGRVPGRAAASLPPSGQGDHGSHGAGPQQGCGPSGPRAVQDAPGGKDVLMTLAPNYHLEDGKMVKRRVSRDADSAVTQYRTLSGTTSCTLLELRPITGVKHQLRVHLAFGLGCPILGDHKYSNWNKLAPQKLPPVILKSLGLEQRKSRYIPLFLHAQRLTLPALGNRSRDLDLECPPSAFFERCLSRLGLEPPGRN